MLAKINRFLERLTQPENEQTDTVTLEVACTVLLCEVMRADGELAQSEQLKLNEMISGHFSLSADEISEIVEQANHQSEHATDFYQFTSKINSHFAINERMRIVEMLWEIALADGEISSVEQHTIRRIADLLHLRHHEYIATKPKHNK